MTRLSAELPKAYPRKLVWWMECDVCQTTRSLPVWNQHDLNLDDFRAAGWDCGPKIDTCPACLALKGVIPARDQFGPFEIAGMHPADRILAAQAITSGLYLQGDTPPTRRQVSAIFHAMADHSLQNLMLSDPVKELGRRDAALGERWQQTTGLGRWFHSLGDWLDDRLKDGR